MSNIGWPLAHNVIRLGSRSNIFGMVRRRADGTAKPHQGWDLEAPIGTPCRAIADGRIVEVRQGVDYGLTVVQSFMHEGRRLYAAFCHLSQLSVARGDAVTRGQVIALTGDSGNAKGLTGRNLHLHFEIRDIALPGLGLAGRINPESLYGVCPLHSAIMGGERV